MSSTEWTSEKLAERFKVSPEAVRRILKSNWRTEEDLQEPGPYPLAEVSPDAQSSRLRAWINGPPESEAEGGNQSLSGPGNNEAAPSATPLRTGFKLDKSSSSYKWARNAREAT